MHILHITVVKLGALPGVLSVYENLTFSRHNFTFSVSTELPLLLTCTSTDVMILSFSLLGMALSMLKDLEFQFI